MRHLADHVAGRVGEGRVAPIYGRDEFVWDRLAEAGLAFGLVGCQPVLSFHQGARTSEEVSWRRDRLIQGVVSSEVLERGRTDNDTRRGACQRGVRETLRAAPGDAAPPPLTIR